MAICSIAIAAGVIGVVAVMKTFAFRRRFGGHGPWAFAPCGPGAAGHSGVCGGFPEDAHGWHAAPWARRSWRRGGGGGPGRSFWLRAIFARLDTTPGQEREIRAAVEELRAKAREAKSVMAVAREDLARAVRGESFDEVAAGEASVRTGTATAVAKDAVEEALKRVHAVLDAEQRERLAELIAEGPGFGRRWGSPYRDPGL